MPEFRRVLPRLAALGVFAAGTVFAAPARAPVRPVPRPATQAFFAELGSSFANLTKVTRSPDASAALLGTHQILLSAAAEIALGSGAFRPELGFTPLARAGEHDTHRSRLWILQLPYLVRPRDGFAWKLGGTLWLHRISGPGGTIELPNGEGTAAFSKPGRSATTSSLGIVGGATFALADRLGLDVDLNLLAPLSSRRNANLLVQLAWRIR